MTTHPFEAEGLGKSPFRCVDYHYEDGGTACSFCSTFIKHVFHIESVDVRRFIVGSECVKRTNDAELREGIKITKKTVLAEKHRLARAAKELADRFAREARNQRLAAERAAAKLAAQKHLGTVGQRLTITVLVDSIKEINSPYGAPSELVRMVDADCNLVTCFAPRGTGPRVTDGDVTITGIVKKHTVFRDEKQTELHTLKVVDSCPR